MSSKKFTKKQLDGFHQAAQSLKLYRRAELQDESDGASLIEQLYVDPLPNEHVFQTMLKPNTTILIGRKGTGKSTIFQRTQRELRKHQAYASAYIDIKTIFESSQVDSGLLAKMEASSGSLPEELLRKLLLYKVFLKSVINQIREELKERVKRSYWERIKTYFTGTFDELFEGLDNLLEETDHDKFISILGFKKYEVQVEEKTSNQYESGGGIEASVSPQPGIKASLSHKNSVGATNTEGIKYSDILMRTFDTKEFILRLKQILNKINVKHLYIFVDDFSELPEEAMKVVVDTLLAPLNNWSEELIKFKVAAYPGRVYYGNIDKTKIDEINLDLYDLYGSTDVNTMEDKAIDFTRRLIESRIKYYSNCDIDVYIQGDEEIWRQFFYATMGNPRNLGYVLYYLHESYLIYEKPLGIRAIRVSAQRYYEDKIEPYFRMNKFLHESFAERSSIYSLKELLEAITQRARTLRDHRKSVVMRELQGIPPTSHFHVLTSLENIFSSLELNFFLTKYYEMKDRDGNRVTVFALNYGLCQKYSIEFGRPIGKSTGKKEHRLYLVERIFNYTPIVNAYLEKNQEIVCGNCEESFGFEHLPSLQFYGMQCPRCKKGLCQVKNLSKKYEETLNAVRPELLLPPTELGILHTLHAENRALFAKEISEELDCSYQLVGKRGKILDERGFVKRNENEQGRRVFEITDLAEQNYFTDDETDGLDIEE
jgi:hypothetical protein